MPAFPSRARAVRHFCSAGILPAPLVILSGACRLVLSENRIFTIFWSTRAVEESLFESLSGPAATYDDPPPNAIWKPRARRAGRANWGPDAPPMALRLWAARFRRTWPRRSGRLAALRSSQI